MPLPPANELIDVESYYSTWPMSAEKCELIDGEVVWQGSFTEDDLVRAQRAIPERQVELDEYGNICLRPRASI